MATSKQVVKPTKPHPNGELPNPTGKGGFADHPENRSDGRWKAEDSISYQYKKFLAMPVNEFLSYEQTVPATQRTVAQAIAYATAFKARKDLGYAREVSDRTEGKAPQAIEIGGPGGAPINVALVEFIKPQAPKPAKVRAKAKSGNKPTRDNSNAGKNTG